LMSFGHLFYEASLGFSVRSKVCTLFLAVERAKGNLSLGLLGLWEPNGGVGDSRGG
jgi:hypothetical protein